MSERDAMSEGHGRASEARTDAERTADHATIGRLADELLPALVAKLRASGLGEIEVREGDWKVRLRMPAGTSDREPARRAGAPVRTSGALPGGTPGVSSSVSHAAAGPASPAGGEAAVAAGGRGSGGDGGRAATHVPRPRAVATSPGVGFYAPGPGLTVGGRVRAGDRLGAVDVLGVPHDVLAPTDGVIGGSYAEPGEAVEYGQELVRIELPRAAHDGPGTPEADGRDALASDFLAPDTAALSAHAPGLDA
jgi:biotin carboxyl carrier protein